MVFELLPTVSLRSRSFNILQAPRDLSIQSLNRNLNLQLYKVLYIYGNYSGVLSKLDRWFQALEIRRAFTPFQLMTVLEEARHSLILIEHDPTIYEDAAEMLEYVSRALSDAAKRRLCCYTRHGLIHSWGIWPGMPIECISTKVREHHQGL